MKKRDIVVIGGSAGSLSVLKKLVGRLPSDFPAAIFIVWHISPDSPGTLPEVLNRFGSLASVNAKDLEKIEKGRIYVAPPDHHLLLEDSRVRVSRGPKENRFRPAVDPLFRSAAQYYGSRVIGVILSGGLDDGTAGLWTVKERGGLAIVQDPHDAESTSMPISALRKVTVDYCVQSSEIADLLVRLVNEEVKEEVEVDMEENRKTKIEVGIADEDGSIEKGVLELGDPSMFACPECHGVLVKITEGDVIRFRCHTGHAYSSGTLLASLNEAVEDSFWNTVRALDESFMLLNHLSRHLKDKDNELAELYEKKAHELQRRSTKVREIVLENGNH
jgi:two-component system chemotaxis response regulator CheB